MEGHGWLISTFSSGNFWNQRQLRRVCEGTTVKARLWVLMDLNQIQLPLTGFVMAVHPQARVPSGTKCDHRHLSYGELRDMNCNSCEHLAELLLLTPSPPHRATDNTVLLPLTFLSPGAARPLTACTRTRLTLMSALCRRQNDSPGRMRQLRHRAVTRSKAAAGPGVGAQ